MIKRNARFQWLLVLPVFFSFITLSTGETAIHELYRSFDSNARLPGHIILTNHEYALSNCLSLSAQFESITLDTIGYSVENRPLLKLKFGQGPIRILLWTQMHGNEPTATAALISIFHYLGNGYKQQEEITRKIFDKLTIHAIILLNPDGAERFNRRNAQDIDINRDALQLATPEGRALDSCRKAIHPQFGFNLHNMYGRETVDRTGKTLKFALMAPAADPQNSDPPNRLKAKQVCVALKEFFETFIPGHIARYDGSYMARAFGDAMQAHGVSTILIEAGTSTDDTPEYLVKLEYSALLQLFYTIANQSLGKYNPNHYNSIPLEGPPFYDLLIKKCAILNGINTTSFISDLAINFNLSKIHSDTIKLQPVIMDIGDLDHAIAIDTIKDTNLIVCPKVAFPEQFKKQLLPWHFAQDYYPCQMQPWFNQLSSELELGQISFNLIPLLSANAKGWQGEFSTIIARDQKLNLILFRKTDNFSLKLDNIKRIIKYEIILPKTF